MAAPAIERLHGALETLILKSVARGPRHGHAVAPTGRTRLSSSTDDYAGFSSAVIRPLAG
jgi:hypothetical protein